MKACLRPLHLLMALLVPSVLLIVTPSAPAVEPAREFLAALRQRKYFDEALQYLDQISKNPAAPIEMKETLLFEKGVTLVEASREQRDPGLREKALNDAQQLLNQFVGQRPDHEKVNAARSQLGNLIVERARMKVEDARKTDDAAQKQAFQAAAATLYEEGFQVFKALQENVKTQLERIPKSLDRRDKQQARMAEQRKQLRADYLETLLLAAAIREESADAVPAKDPKHLELLTDAAAQYADIYTKYRSLLAGLYARMYQGRCNQKMEKFRDALGYFSELLDQPDEPEPFRLLKTRTLKLAMECWLDESEKKFVEAIKRGDAWVSKSRPTEDREPDWLYLRYMLAKAYQMQGVDAKARGDSKAENRSRSEARKLAQFVSKYTSDYQKDAQQLVAELGGPDRTGEKVVPKTFAEAKNAGKEALDSIQPATLVVSKVPARIAAEKDPTVKAELQKQLDAAELTLETAQDDAMAYFRDALRLADAETPSGEIAVVRYFLCYLYYTRKDYFDAGLMGEFISRRYPGTAGARPCAQIALASYLTLYDENQSEDKSFEIRRIVSIAEYTVDKWPDQAEAADAVNTLIRFSIDAGELDRAETFLSKLPATSDKLGEAQLKLGQAIWRECLERSRVIQEAEKNGAPAGTDLPTLEAELKTLQAKAREVLAAGFASPRSGEASGSLLLSALSLAQVYVEAKTPEDAALAIAVLENPQAGPLTLVRAGHPGSKNAGYVQETFKTALRAYILVLGSTDDADATIAKAKQVMSELKTAMGDTPQGNARLINVYVGLASDLDERMAVASDEAKDSLSQGFEAFLSQLSQDATELNVMNWVAETYDRLGRGFDTQTALTETANRYYGEAAKAFANIVDLPGVTPELKVQVRIRQAQLKSRQRQFKAALDLYEELLKESQVMLNVQVDAAMAYQQWAGMPNKETLYERALLGARADEKTKKNVIWGWRKIGDVTSRHLDKFRDVFHESRYNQALCRLKFAEAKPGAERKKWLDLAETEIKLLVRLYPDLGGAKWTGKYDDLLKDIQKAKGDQPLGLKKYKADVTAKAGG